MHKCLESWEDKILNMTIYFPLIYYIKPSPLYSNIFKLAFLLFYSFQEEKNSPVETAPLDLKGWILIYVLRSHGFQKRSIHRVLNVASPWRWRRRRIKTILLFSTRGHDHLLPLRQWGRKPVKCQLSWEGAMLLSDVLGGSQLLVTSLL